MRTRLTAKRRFAWRYGLEAVCV